MTREKRRRKRHAYRDDVDEMVARLIHISGVRRKGEIVREVLGLLFRDLSGEQAFLALATNEVNRSLASARREGQIELPGRNDIALVDELEPDQIGSIDERVTSRMLGEAKTRIRINSRHGRIEERDSAARVAQLMLRERGVEKTLDEIIAESVAA